MNIDVLSNIASLAMGVVLALLLVVYLARYFLGALCPEHPLMKFLNAEKKFKKPEPLSFGRLFLRTFLLMLTAQALYWGVLTLMSYFHGRSLPYSISTLWDAGQYYSLTEHGYLNVGDESYRIVFYPLYPMLCRLLYLSGVPILIAEYSVTILCYLGAGMTLYSLVRLDYGDAVAHRALVFFAFCPVSFFFVEPFTESMFVFLTLLAVFLAKKRKFAWAVAVGALCSACRSLGIATAIPVFWEMLCALREKYADEDISRATWAKEIAICVLKTLPVATGLLVYLWMNWYVTGSAFTFMVYESEHWGATFESPMNTIAYSIRYMVYYDDFFYRVGMWIPQTVLMVFVLILMCVTWRRQKPRDCAYGLVYYYCSMALGWLISGMRYLAGMYPVYPMLALITRKRWQYTAALVLEILIGIYLYAMFAIWYVVL